MRTAYVLTLAAGLAGSAAIFGAAGAAEICDKNCVGPSCTTNCVHEPGATVGSGSDVTFEKRREPGVKLKEKTITPRSGVDVEIKR
jgi:hypothetical protein